MKIVVLAIGRLKGPEQDLCDRYIGRIAAAGRRSGISGCSAIILNEARGNHAGTRKKQEAEALLAKIDGKSLVVALDEGGKALTSHEFAQQMARFVEQGAPELVFVLGGPDGHGDALLRRADRRLSLSNMTMPHGLARVVLCEQVYRALTILDGHPYHRC